MSISIEYLAKLGRQRTISSLFERVWMQAYGGGSNPVAKAMQIVENRRKSRSRNVSLFVGVMLLASLAFLAWGGLGVDVADMDSKSAGDVVAYVIPSVCLALALMAVFLVFEDEGEKVDNGAESQIASFCECLDLARGWASLSFELLLPDNEEAIKQIGTDILVESAIDVLRAQENEKSAESPGAKERLQVSAGNARAEFTRRYNTLRQIGLASGGYDKYFEIAQRNTDAASKNLPKAVEV